MKQRNIYFDFLKGSVICLVIVGHSIQYGSGATYLNDGAFFDNFLFRMIYCFHMPIFMMISGFFFSFSIAKYSFGGVVKNRMMHLLFPILSWGTLEYLLLNVREHSTLINVAEWGHCVLYGLWFLWAIFYASAAVIVVNFFFNDCLLIYFVGWLVTFFIPDTYNLQLYKFMYPYFIISYFFGRKYELYKEKLKTNMPFLICISGIVTFALFPFFNYDAYIYTTGYCVWNGNSPIRQFLIDIYRMIIGFSGSVFWACLMYLIYQKKPKGIVCRVLSKMGYIAMGLYVISGYLFTYVLKEFSKNFEQNYVLNFIESVGILGISIVCTKVLVKYRVTNKFLLGGK